MNTRLWTAGLAAVVVMATMAQAAVRLNDGTTHATVQAAVNAATNGDTLKVTGGVYAETVLVTNKNLTIEGGWNVLFNDREGGETVVDAGGGGTALWLADSSSRVDRVTFTGGAGMAENLGCGGGVLLHRSWAEFTDCLMVSNTAAFGAGLFVGQFAYAMLTGATEVRTNTAAFTGGGIFVDGRADLVHSNVVVAGNTAAEGHGGGIWVETGYLRLFQGRVEGNEALPGSGGSITSLGGGIGAIGSFVEAGDDAVFYANEAVNGGGMALLNSTGHLGRAKLADCYFGQNAAAGRGGGLYASNSTLQVNGTACWADTAIQGGGGVWLHSCTVNSDTNGLGVNQCATEGNGGGLYLENCTARVSRLMVGDLHPITGNTAGGDGGGLYALNSDLEFRGTHFRHNTATNPMTAASGGGIALTASTLIITNATAYGGEYAEPWFEANQASTNWGTGGAIHADGGSTVTVYQAVFIDQRAHRGGAVFADGGEAVLSDCAFGGNRALTDGGAVMFDQAMASLLECVFEGNEAETGEGGAVHGDTLPYLFLVDSVLTGNVASNSGGGLYARDSWVRVYGIPPLGAPTAGWRSVFRGNAAYQGGGMTLANCDAVVSHTGFESNSAPGYASGMYVAGGYAHVAHVLATGGTQPPEFSGLAGAGLCVATGGTGVVWNCTFADNEGDGLRLYAGELWATNSLIWGNNANAANITTSGAGVVSAAYCNVGGGWPGAGNIDQDPMLSPTYHLRHGSPCIDAGVVPAGLFWPWDDNDADGEVRPAGGVWDIGCDEFLDGDGDRMPDVAETGTGTCAGEDDLGTNPGDPDSDGDGVGDGDEWAADTNPNDGGDFLRFLSIEPSATLPGGVSVTWAGGTNAQQELDWAPGPDGPWQNVLGYPPPTFRTNTAGFMQAGVTGVCFRVRAFRP